MSSTRRTALVTGGGGGIGGAICEVLADEGLSVAVADLAATRDEVADRVGGLAVELDVSSPESVARAVAKVTSELGEIDVLVNCAGWDELRPFVETDEEFQRKVLSINLEGPIRLTRATVPGMIERGHGRLINIASDAGRVGSSLESIYSAAKGGLIAFTKTMAREAARHGVTANSVCPGPTSTPLLDGIVDASDDGAKVIAAMTRAVPMKRLGEPLDVAAAVGFLASEKAAFITGQTLSVSGGLTMA